MIFLESFDTFREFNSNFILIQLLIKLVEFKNIVHRLTETIQFPDFI